jgi:hypothetical protein
VAVRRETTVHYSCDRCRLQARVKRCPEGWRYLNTLIPGKEKQQPEIKALICATCDEWLKQQLDAICMQENQGEEELEIYSSTCTRGKRDLSLIALRTLHPSFRPGPSGGSRPPSIPLGGYFSSGEAALETGSREGTPSQPSSGTEQRESSAIHPIRRLFQPRAEEETDSSEGTPCPRSPRVEWREPFAIDPIRRLFQQGEPSAEEVEAGRSEGTPCPRSPRVEQGESSTIDPIR